jgi:hypothetical protein
MRLPCAIASTVARNQQGVVESALTLTFLNLSVDGALVSANQPLAEGDVLDVTFCLPDSPEQLTGKLEVQWARPDQRDGASAWIAGTEFVPPSPIAAALAGS